MKVSKQALIIIDGNFSEHRKLLSELKEIYRPAIEKKETSFYCFIPEVDTLCGDHDA